MEAFKAELLAVMLDVFLEVALELIILLGIKWATSVANNFFQI